MVRPRPRRALRSSRRVRVARIAIPSATVAALATALTVSAWPSAQPLTAVPAAVTAAPVTAQSAAADRTTRPSRDNLNGRPQLAPTRQPPATSAPPSAVPSPTQDLKPSRAPKPKPTKESSPTAKVKVTGSRYATVPLKVRSRPAASSGVVTTVNSGTRLQVTNTVQNGFRLVRWRQAGRWVSSEYLSKSKPAPAPKKSESRNDGTSGRPCASGSAVERGLTADAILVHRAVCARFPGVTSYGGVRPDSLPDHPAGRALDAMISSQSYGWEIANFVRNNSRSLGVKEVIFSRRIWTVQRGSEGWRSMSDRGSPSANHYDHVHVTVYGNSGSG